MYDYGGRHINWDSYYDPPEEREVVISYQHKKCKKFVKYTGWVAGDDRFDDDPGHASYHCTHCNMDITSRDVREVERVI